MHKRPPTKRIYDINFVFVPHELQANPKVLTGDIVPATPEEAYWHDKPLTPEEIEYRDQFAKGIRAGVEAMRANIRLRQERQQQQHSQ